ncbi:MAG: DUF4394 domain-containing protein [Hyphomicrobiaceae bacterium]
MKPQILAILIAGGLTLGATGARAADAIALVGDDMLVPVDLATAKTGTPVKVTGVGRLLGIDVRPSNKMLYGVATDGTIVTIDQKTGKAKKVAKLDTMLPGAPKWAIVDFNPAADKLRFMGSDGTNLRADVDSGKVTKDGSLAFEKGDMHHGERPAVVAAAYTNSHGKPKTTAMYDIDATIGALIRQTKPNDGTLKAVGKLGIAKAGTYALDVASTADGANTAWLAADNAIYKVALDSGKATMTGKVSGIEGTIRDIAVLAN